MSEKKVPELRFKGFTEDWEQRKLANIINRKNISSNSNKLPKIEFEDIVAGEGRLNKDISHKFDDRKGIIFEPGNILYGKLRPYLKNWLLPDFKGIALGDFWVFEAVNTDEKFDYYLIQADKYQKVANDTSGTKMPRSDWKQVSMTYFSIPSLREQIKIGSFFKQLDDTIALHQEKLEKLKQLKRAYLQVIFPQKGERTPRLRFANFSGDWEQRKLGDVTQVTMGQSPSSENYTDNPEDYILVQGNADMKDGRVTPRVWTTQITKLAEENDLILSVRAPVGDIGKTDYKAVLGRGVAGIKGNEFIFQLLGKMKQEKFWTKLSTGSTFESINSKDIQEAMLVMPNRIEQKIIGELFLTLDNTIALRQKKILILQEIKKIYLQKMFT